MTRLFAKRDSRRSCARRRKGTRKSPSLAQSTDCSLGSRLMLEPLEDRWLLAASSFLDEDAAWKAEGPAPILYGSGENIPAQQPVVGAIQAVAAHPTNPGIIWVGGTNGGVWRSESLIYANDGLDNDNQNGIDDPNEVWTATYGQDSFDNDNDGQTDEADEIHWQPLTDDQGSLTIGDLVLDPTDATHNTLIVGIGRASSSNFRGGPITGVLRITDASQPTSLGGVTVSKLEEFKSGRNISGVAAGMTDGGDNVVLVAANSYGVSRASAALSGLYQITNPGQPNEQVNYLSGVANLPKGPAYDVIVDPSDHTRFYAAIGGSQVDGTDGGLFRSEDGGNTWTDVGVNSVTNSSISPASTPNGSISGTTGLMEMAIHDSVDGNILYVAIVNGIVNSHGHRKNYLSAIYWTDDQGANWTAMDLPQTEEDGTDYGIHVGGQGNKHLSIAADPTNADIVYVGGDRQPRGNSFPNSIGAQQYTGRLFRGDRNVTANGAVPSPQWDHLTHDNTSSSSAPHADSRMFAFWPTDAGHAPLIEVDDGGIYVRTTPKLDAGDWFPLSGTLQIAEVYSVAYDSNSHTIFAGSQDNGTSRQSFTGSNTVWVEMYGGDGGDVDVDHFTLAESGQAIRYLSSQFLGGAIRKVYDNTNSWQSDERIFPVDSGGNNVLPFGFDPGFLTPLEVNRVRPTDAELTANKSTRLAVGANIIIEADDAGTAIGGASWTQVPTDPNFNGVNRAAMFYGGSKKGLGIIGATNASPIVITSNAHGLSNGDQVEISGVVGNAAANGSFIVSSVTSNTFALVDTTGDGDYVSGGSWRQLNPHLLYVGSDHEVWVRKSAGTNLVEGGALVASGPRPTSVIRDVVADPDDWETAYAVDDLGRVFQTLDTGDSWTDITGNLDSLLESATRSVSGVDANLWAAEVLQDVILPGFGRAPQNVPVVGGAFGVFYLSGETSPTGGRLWRRLGAEIPNSIVVDLDQGVDPDGNTILVASTLGRGVFSMTIPKTLGLPQVTEMFGEDQLNISLTGATIITHGFEPFDNDGDSMLPLANEIREITDAANGADGAWLLDYDSKLVGFDTLDSDLPDLFDLDASGELVLLFDWTDSSQHISSGWPEAAGDALFGLITELGLVDPASGSGVDLHFIGHGTGAVVTSEAVERLAYFNVPVDHVTYLDPHDFDQGLVYDTAQELDSHASLSGYGAAVWSNVDFADVYYQTRGSNGASVADELVPTSRPIPGAVNHYIDASTYLPNAAYESLNVFGDHRYIWEGFYLSTVNDVTPINNQLDGVTNDTPDPAVAIPTSDLGYAYGRIKNTATRPSPSFFTNPDRGSWLNGELYKEFDRVEFGGMDYIALRTHTARNSGVGEPAANQPPDPDFWELVTDPNMSQDHVNTPEYLANNVDGTPHQAGLLEHRVSVDSITNSSSRPQWDPLEIVNGNFEHVSDLIGLSDRRLPGWSDFSNTPQFDPVNVAIDVAEENVTLDAAQPGLTHNWVYVPAEAEFVALDIKVTSFSGNDRLEVVLGDTVLVEESPATDDLDLTFIDAEFKTHRFVVPESLREGVNNLTIRLNDGGDNAFNAEVKIDNLRFEGYFFDVLAGDVTMIDLGSVLPGSSFSLVAPLVHDAGQVHQADQLDPAESPFADTGRLYFVPDFNTDGRTLVFDDDDLTPGNDDLATIRFEVDLGSGLVEKSARVRVFDGYSTSGENSIILTGSVGSAGVNNELEVYEVQQRLRYFNARGKNNAEVVVDGVVGTVTQDAIRIFQAQTREDGLGDPAITSFYVDGRVDVNHRTIRWLNSPLAPFWGEARVPLRNRIDFADEGFAASWTRQTIENAVEARPELKRIGDFEEFGVNNLSEWPDNGPKIHPTPSHKGGNTIDWEIEQDALLGAGTGTDPIDLTLPVDLNQAAITQAERDTIEDVLAFVGAAQAAGSQVGRVDIGGTGGQPSYSRIRSVLSAMGVPNVNNATSRHSYFTVHLLPPNGEWLFSVGVQDGLLSVLSSMRDNLSTAIVSQELLQTKLPLVDLTVAESIDLNAAIGGGLVDPVVDLFNSNPGPHLHHLQEALTGHVFEDQGLKVELHNVHVDIDAAGSSDSLLLRLELRAVQVNDVNAGGDLPQNSGSGPQNILDPTAAATNFLVDLNLPLEVRVPVNFTPTSSLESEILVTPGDVTVEVASVNIRDFEGSVGVIPVRVHHDPVVMLGEMKIEFSETDADGYVTLEQLNDPFLNDAIVTTPVSSLLEGILPLEFTFCDLLNPGAAPELTVSSADIFNGLPAEFVGNGDFSPLTIFENLSNVEIVSFLNSLGTTLNRLTALTDSGDGLLQNIPFVGDSLTSLIDAGAMITDLIEELTNGTEIFFENFNQLIERLQTALGTTADALNVRCDGDAVLMDLNFEREYSLTVPLDFGGNVGPLDIAAEFDAELYALIEANLTIGFDFNSSDVTPTDFLNTPLGELNGSTGVNTVPGPDLEVVLPNDVFSFNDVAGELYSFMTPTGDNDLYKEELDNDVLSSGLISEFSGAGYSLTGAAEITVIAYGDHWRIRDGNSVYELIANGPTIIDVTVSSVNSVDLDVLAASATVEDAFNLINTSTGGQVSHTVVADPETGLAAGYRLDYGGIPVGAAPVYSIKPVENSEAAGDLGIFSQDNSGTGVVTGTIRTKSLADRFFLAEDSGVSLNAGIVAEQMGLSASFGGLGLAIVNGDLNVALETSISLNDPGVGVNANERLTLTEIFDNSLGDMIDFQTPIITGSGRLPLIGQSEGFDINGVLGIDPNHPYTEDEPTEQPILIEDGPEIHISITSNPFNIEVTTNEYFDEIIDGFQHFSVDSVCDGIQQLISLIRNADIDVLNNELPLINKSVNELIEADGILQSIVDVLCADPGQLKVDVQAIVDDELDKADAPLGAIPNIFNELDADQQATITELHDALLSALGQPDLSDLPSLLAGVVTGFNTFIESLPSGIDSSQLAAVVSNIDALLPSADGIEATVEDLLGIAPEDFVIEFIDADGDLLTPGLAAVARLTLGVNYAETLPLDFDFGDDIPVNIETGGDLLVEFGGELQLDFGVDLTDGLDLEDRGFLLAYDDVSTEGTAAKLTAKIEATGLSMDVVVGGIGGANVVSGGRVELKELHTSTTTPANANGATTSFTLGTSVPAAAQDLAFVSVDGEIQNSATYSINGGGNEVTFTVPPSSGAVLIHYPDATNPASLRLDLVDAASPGDALNIVPFSELFDAGDAFAVGDFVDFSGINGMIGANLPFSIPLVTPFDVRGFVNLSDLSSPDSFYLEFPTDLSTSLSTAGSADCNVPGMVSGIQAFLDVLDVSLQSEVMQQLPIVGEITEPGGFFSNVRDVVDTMLLALADTDSLRNFLFENLGEGSPSGTGAKLGILRDAGGGEVDSLAEIGDFSDPALANQARLPTTGSTCGEIKLRIGDSITLPVQFDLGLESFVFDVEATGGLDLTLDYDIEIGLGIDKAKGIYFILNDDAMDPEIEITPSVTLQNGTELTVDLFFLRVAARENTGDNLGNDPALQTGITGSIDLNINGSQGNPSELPLGDITSTPFSDLFDLDLNVTAIVDLELEGGTTDPNLPSVKVNFFLDWQFDANFGDPDPFEGTLNTVGFDDFRLDLGGYVAGVLKPIVQQIDEYLQPIDPLLEFIGMELPLISQVSEMLGQGPVTVIDVISLFGDGAESVAEALDIVIAIREMVDRMANSPNDSFEISFGSYDLLSTGKDLREEGNEIEPEADGGNITGDEDFNNKIDSTSGDDSPEGFFANILSTLRDIGIEFPLLDDPFHAFNLLLGQPVDLVTYDLLGTGENDRLEAGFDWELSLGILTPPVPLYANIFAGFDVFFDMIVGYDTYGLQTTGNAIDGFYFGDERPMFGISAEFGAGAEINAALIWAGVQGKLTAEIGAGWNEVVEDDKMRFEEIAQRLGQGIECLFELRGSMDAAIEAYAGLGIKIFGAKITIFEVFIDIFRATVFEFTAGCPPLPPPEPARLVGSELTLNIGPDAGYRQSGAEDEDEVVSVEYDADADQFIVSGFGVIQELDGASVSSIAGDGGSGNDEITIGETVIVPVTLRGGDDDDVLVGGAGQNVLYGGAGVDRLTGRDADDTLYGEDGDDTLLGGGGDDHVEGGDGNDQIRGDDGDDTLLGGDGDDDLSGGQGMDTISGNDGSDHLSGGPEGDSHTNILNGNAGDDSIEASGFGDTIFGDEGNDIISGNIGPDIIHAGPGNDIVLADDGADQIWGDDGDDDLDSGPGDDVFFFEAVSGGFEVDRVQDVDNGGLDRLDFSALTAGDPVSVNLLNGQATHTNRRVEIAVPNDIEDATGGAGDDSFYDNRRNNTFVGNAGSDRYFFHRADGLSSASHIDTIDESNDPTGLHDELNFADLPVSDPLVADISAAETALTGITVAVHTTRTVVTAANGQRAYLEDITGGAADDEIYGNEAENILIGNGGSDDLFGNGAADEIYGNAGSDTIEGNGGADLIYAGPDDDIVYGNAGGDEIYGGAGIDYVEGNQGADTIHGDAGDDDLFGDSGPDIIVGGTGDDFVFAGTGDDTVEGNAGFDTIFGEDGNDTILGGTGEDRLFGMADDDTIEGGPGRDFILGDIGNDTLLGGSGDDFISGGGDSGNQSLDPMALMLDSSDFGDHAFGGDGHDFIVGGWPIGYDALQNLVGNLFVDMFAEVNAAPRPMIFTPFDSPLQFIDLFLTPGEFTFPRIPGGDVTVTFQSGPASQADQDDLLHGDFGNDLVVGDEGDDYLFGDWGNDVLFAYQISADELTLPNTTDRLEGGPDHDLPMCGTNGENLFVGGTSDMNLDYILNHPGAPFASPVSGGYVFETCFDDTPELLDNLPVEIHGQKYRDVDGDGSQGPEEQGLDGWTIELRDIDGNLLASTVTTSVDLNEDGAIDPYTESGLYWFKDSDEIDGNVESMLAGIYLVSEVLPVGWNQTQPVPGYELLLESGDVGQAVEYNFGGDPILAYTLALDSGVLPEDVEIATDVDFGNIELSTISGFKWEDVDGDGIRDPEDLGLPGWEITLLKTDLSFGETVVTDENGQFRFDNIEPNESPVQWALIETGQPGWQATSPVSGLHVFDVGVAETIDSYSFGNVQLGAISGTKWEDLDGDGVFDEDELGIAGFEIYLDLNLNRQFDAGEPDTITDVDGNYAFTTDILPGIYVVAEKPVAGWVQTFPGEADLGLHMVEVVSGSVFTDLDFGNYQKGQIIAGKFSDPNGDGIVSDGSPLSGWTLFLDDNDNGILDDGELSGTTDASGLVFFDDLDPGNYIVAEVPQDGWAQTYPEEHADSGRREYRLTMTSGAIQGAVFGNAPSIDIQGIKWHDLDADGVQDPGEPGLPNWTIYLDLNLNGELDFNEFNEPTEPTFVTRYDDPATEDVDETGEYAFNDLPLGTYTIGEVPQDGWRQTFPADNAGMHQLRDNDNPSAAFDFGNVRTGSISGTKWVDLAGDGVRQFYDNVPDKPQGDVGLSQWVIYLDLNENGVIDWDTEPFTVTSADDPETDENEAGRYRFEDLLPGTYVVAEVPQTDWIQSYPGRVDYEPHEVVLSPGEALTDLDFANLSPAEIHGMKWLDRNGDGVKDIEGEPGLSKWTIYLDLNINGKLDYDSTGVASEPFQLTDAHGEYSFTGLLPGTYVVAEVQGDHPWQQTYPTAANLNRHIVQVTSGDVIREADFGNRRFGDCDQDGRVHQLELQQFSLAFH